jgi:hypothetical protein
MYTPVPRPFLPCLTAMDGGNARIAGANPCQLRLPDFEIGSDIILDRLKNLKQANE